MKYFLHRFNKIFFFFILLVTGTFLHAQSTIDLDLSKVENDVLDSKFDSAEEKLNKLLSNNKNNELNTVKIYIEFVNLYSTKNDFDKALYYCNLSRAISDKSNDKLDDAFTLLGFAKIYLINQLYDKTIKNANEALVILKQYPNENLLLAKIYLSLCSTHSRSGIYSEDYKNYALKAFEYVQKSQNPTQIINTYAELVLMYMAAYNANHKKEDLDKIFENAEAPIQYFKNAKKGDFSEKALGTSYNNLASIISTYPYENYSESERTKIAENYLVKAIEIGQKNDIKSLLAVCYATYAEVCETKKDDKKAEQYYLKSYETIKSIKGEKRQYAIVYITNALYQLYKNRNDYPQSLKFLEENLKYTKESYKYQLDNKRKFLEAYYDTEQKKSEITQLEEKNNNFAKQKWMYIGMIVLAIGGVFSLILMLRSKQKINKQRTDLLEAEKIETELTLQLEKEEKARLKAEQELMAMQQEHLQKQALANSIQLNHKNTFINDLKEKIKENDINLDSILREEKLTDNDLKEIQNLVQEVHPTFFKRLNEVSKNKLTNQDLKYSAYIYLNMDNQQIANILKVEAKTVRMTKYRLKQKLGLDRNDDLQQFIQNLIL